MPEPTEPPENDATRRAPGAPGAAGPEGRPVPEAAPPPASVAPTVVGPPSPGTPYPPPPAAPQPPYLAPPVAAAPYGQQPGQQYGQQYGQPPGQQYGQYPPGAAPSGSRRRLATILAVVTAVLLLAGGGLIAFLVASGDDDDKEPTVSKGEEGSEETDEPAALDPAAAEADLVAVADELFPADSTQDYVEAHSWSVAADNLAEDQPRDLADAEREGATQWEVRNTRGDHSYWVYVEHIASDYQQLRTPPACEPTATTFCETLTTPSGQTAYEQVFTYDGGGSHYLWVPGDAATGRPDVSIGESVSGLTGEPDAEELIGLTELPVDEQLAALDDERLQVLLPEVLPPLPSFAACAYTTDPPADCPPGLQ